MKALQLMSVLVAAIFWTASASADSEDKGGLFVEPGLTYEVGSPDGDFPNGDQVKEADGLGVSARLGFHVSEAFFAGIDGRFSKLTVKTDSNSYDATGNSFNWGPVVGVQMPDLGLRIWGTYVVNSMIDPEGNNGLDIKIDDGTGYRIGAGFRLSVVSLNLEYQNLKYDTLTLQQVGPFAPGSFGGLELENESWIASVSFPLEL